MNNLEDLKISSKEKISDFPLKFNKLIVVVERIVYIVSVISAIVLTLILRSLLFSPISHALNLLNFNWGNLSEGYQLLFLGVPMTIIAGIATHFINKKYIDPILERN